MYYYYSAAVAKLVLGFRAQTNFQPTEKLIVVERSNIIDTNSQLKNLADKGILTRDG